jgi:hypothetical protein
LTQSDPVVTFGQLDWLMFMGMCLACVPLMAMLAIAPDVLRIIATDRTLFGRSGFMKRTTAAAMLTALKREKAPRYRRCAGSKLRRHVEQRQRAAHRRELRACRRFYAAATHRQRRRQLARATHRVRQALLKPGSSTSAALNIEPEHQPSGPSEVAATPPHAPWPTELSEQTGGAGGDAPSEEGQEEEPAAFNDVFPYMKDATVGVLVTLAGQEWPEGRVPPPNAKWTEQSLWCTFVNAKAEKHDEQKMRDAKDPRLDDMTNDLGVRVSVRGTSPPSSFRPVR